MPAAAAAARRGAARQRPWQRTPSRRARRARPLRAASAAPRRGAPCEQRQTAERRAAASCVAVGSVVGACASASAQLLLVCGLVSGLSTAGRLPPETPKVLSKVAFEVCIPAFLLARVAGTMATQPLADLALIPALAAAQVAVGYAAGVLGVRLVYGARAAEGGGGEGGGASGVAASSAAAALTVGAAVRGGGTSGGAAAYAAAFLPPAAYRPPPPELLGRRLALAASAFGNTLTLPLLFLYALLETARADAAAGYVALFLIGWSPALWSVGYSLLALGEDGGDNAARANADIGARQALGGSLGTSDSGSAVRLALPAPAPSAAAAGSARAAQKPLRRLLVTVAALWRRVANPPLIAILCGVALGLTPFAGAIFPPSGAAATDVLDYVPAQVRLIGQALRTCGSALAMLGSATLALQAIVLGSSLSTAMARLGGPPDWRPLLVSCFARFVAVPVATLAAVLALRANAMLPADAVIVSVILVQACMPSAQNLVLLANLSPEADKAAPQVSRLLLWQYALAVLPVTLWLGVFAYCGLIG